MIIHHITPEDCDILAGMVAEPTPEGWVIPEWVQLLEDTANERSNLDMPRWSSAEGGAHDGPPPPQLHHEDKEV